MIETKTLLIVGAGASVPYGYPAGLQLKEELCNPKNLDDLENRYYKVHARGLELFCQHFSASQQNSIDTFLAKRGGDEIGKQPSGAHMTFGTYGSCGKLAIACRLIKCEIPEKLREPEEDHWLQYVWQFISDVATETEFKNNQLKVISFNYDRVIEQYFQSSIEHTFTSNGSINGKEATELRKFIEIVHVYGNLQDLEDRDYGKMPSDIQKVADCIRVIPEARDANDEHFKRAKELIEWADKICFIGFGFDKTNMSRLGFPNYDLSGKKICGTAFNMKDSEISVAEKLLGSKFLELDNRTNLKTLDYLRETGFFIL
jgi:hypothetical protein